MDYARIIREIFSQFTGPRFAVRLWDGTEEMYGAGERPAFTLVIDDETTARRLLAQGALGFGESYMAGTLRIEGDLDAYLRMRHQFKHVRRSLRLMLATYLSMWSVPRTRKQQIAAHYDLGNDFFKLILDTDTLSYSAGYFAGEGDTLAQAQQRKLEFLGDWLDLPAGSRVLDLGAGWGGFARLAAQRGLQVTGYSLSKAQLEYCAAMLAHEHLEERVSLEYRDMLKALPANAYDGIMMLESIEHVGKEHLPAFFRNLYGALKPGGPCVLQLTGRYQPRRVDRWTLKYVFPGGYLPAKGELLEAAEAAGFVLEEFRDDTTDYVRTMSEWIRNLEQHKGEIEQMFDPSLYRLWELWMHGARVSFELGAMQLFRVRLRRPH